MADYTAFVEAGNALVELLRDNMTPEPLDHRETISLGSPHENENSQLTLFLYHIEEESQNETSAYQMAGKDVQRIPPAQYTLRFLATAHSKAPEQMKEADCLRIMGAVIQTVRDHPVIPRKYLSGSMAEEMAALHISVERTPFDQIYKVWNDTSKPYKLSVVIMLTGATIASKRTRRVSRVTELTIGTEEKPQDTGEKP